MQVIWKQELRDRKVVRIGTILAFSPDGKRATVTFPGENIRRELWVKELTPVGTVYGRDRVELHPARRLVDFLR